MKKITELKIKQKQNLNLLNFIKDTKFEFNFLNSAIRLSINESINFYTEILNLKNLNKNLIETTETQDATVIYKKITYFVNSIPDDNLLLNVSFSQYETFLDDGEYYNISPLPVFKLNKEQVRLLLDGYLHENLYFFAIISHKFKLVLDSYAGNTNSLKPDLPTYEYFEEFK